MSDNKLPALVDTQEKLQTACCRMDAAKFVTIDIEFVWTTTYYPRLGLIQAASSSEECWLIDPVAIQDLSSFGQILSNRDITKVLHDAQQDLEILIRATGAVPQHVFDTRLAAGYCGLISTISLSSLLAELFGISLSKEEQRSDWCARPLTQAQITYALADVRHLPAAFETLTKRIFDKGRTEWLAEDLAEFDNKSSYAPRDERQLFRRVKGWSSLANKQIAVLREVAAWREKEAQERDKPRKHVISDDSLLRVASAMPRTMAELASSRAISERNGRRFGATLLDAVAKGLACPEKEWPSVPPLPEAWREIKLSVNTAIDFFRTKGEREGIDPILIATNAEATALVSDGLQARVEDHKLLRGWRRGFVGEEVIGKMMRREKI